METSLVNKTRVSLANVSEPREPDEAPLKRGRGRPRKYMSDDATERIRESQANYRKRMADIFNEMNETQREIIHYIRRNVLTDEQTEAIKAIIAGS